MNSPVPCFVALFASLVLLAGGCGREQPVSKSTRPQTAGGHDPVSIQVAIQTCLRRGDLEGASRQVNDALLFSPDDPVLLTLAGDVAVGQRDSVRATELYELALSNLDQPNGDLLIKLGQEWMNVGRPFESIRVMEVAVAAYPDVPDYRLKLVGLQAALGLEFESRQHLQWLVQRGHGSLDLLIILSDLSRPQTVESTCKYALNKYPKDLRPQFSLARLPCYHSEWQKVADLLEPVIQRHPDFVPAQAWYGRALSELNRTDAIKAWSRDLPKGIDEEPQYWLALGGLAEQRGELPKAARAYWNAAILDENNGEALLKLSVSLSQLGKPDEAQALAQRAAGITALRDGVDSLLSWKNNSQSAAVEIARDLDGLGRRWEATAWLQAAYPMTQNKQPDFREIYQSIRSSLSGNTPWQIPDFLVAKRIDLSDYPPPLWSEVARDREALSQGTGSTVMRFSDQAKQRKLVHTCRLGKNETDGGGLAIYQSGAGGVGVVDFDLDGWPDVYLTSIDGKPMQADSSSNRLFRNLVGVFADVTEPARARDHGFAQGISVGDYNSDGFPDLFVANIGRNRLLCNNGDGTFSDVTDQSGLLGQVWTSSAALVDIDGDGLTDLFELGYCRTENALNQLCMDAELQQHRSCAPLAFAAQQDRVWRGGANGTFTDVTATWLGTHDAGRSLGIVVGALDDRPGTDLYIANDMTANHYWSLADVASQSDPNLSRSEKSEFRLSEQASIRGLAVNQRSLSQASMGIAAGDADQDGDVDFLLTHFSADYNTYYEQVAPGMWADRSKRVGLMEPSHSMLGYGTQWIDADNDGASELLVANGDIDDFTHQDRLFRQPVQLFGRSADGLWSEVQREGLGDYFQRDHLGRAVVTLDVNRDQKSDLLITHLFEPVALLVNETISTNSQCRFFPVGTRSGRDAIGTKVTLRQDAELRIGRLLAGDGFQCSNERCICFGLSDEQGRCEVLVDWPDGTRESYGQHRLSGDYLLIQGSGELYSR